MIKIINRFSILAIASVISIVSSSAACTASPESVNYTSSGATAQSVSAANDGPKAENKANENKANENKSVEAAKTRQSPIDTSTDDRKAVSGKEVTGTFRMNFKGEFKDSYNEILIQALGDNKLKVAFNLIYPIKYGDKKDDLSANIGQLIVAAPIKGDTAVYSNTEDGKCEITIKSVKPGEIVVTQEQEGSGCGFGFNVTAEGSYKKTSSENPDFTSIQ